MIGALVLRFVDIDDEVDIDIDDEVVSGDDEDVEL